MPIIFFQFYPKIDGLTVEFMEIYFHLATDMATKFLLGTAYFSPKQHNDYEAEILTAINDAQFYIEQKGRRDRIGKLMHQPGLAKCVRTLRKFVDHQIDRGLEKCRGKV